MIKAPNYAKDAIPTLKGWVSPKGELLVARKFTQEQIDEYLNKDKPKVNPKAKPKTKAKKSPVKKALDKLAGKK
jgi:hypothetical protein